MPYQDNKDVVLAFYDGWNRGSIDIDGLVAVDIVNHQPDAEPEHGRERFAAALSGVMAVVPDSQWTVLDVMVDEDRVAVRITWSGTYGASSFRGIDIPAPSSFSVEHIHIYRVSDGKLAEHWVVRDDLGMLKQLGAVPA